ncbi:MAG: hypothetical protein IPQ14_06330 [Candidatus Microthrix sp.]|uniref:RCC1 domain-containing protein n=1 Tax=Candidatus Neomicrothrix sp. TaxID=2719034 RepID=UPI0025BEB319|nr:RCC1 domain-containing protein [Candidatus Microthrix sp.]MBL0203941.1 hypothetical protein [Candidatus Microthrix sp.]
MTAVSGGSVHNCAQKSNGTVACWVPTTEGQLGDGSNTTRTTPLTVANLSGVTAVDSGWLHLCRKATARLTAGATTVMASSDWATPPTQHPGDHSGSGGVTTIGVGAYHGCAVKAGGTVACWGYNKDGQAAMEPPASTGSPRW